MRRRVSQRITQQILQSTVSVSRSLVLNYKKVKQLLGQFSLTILLLPSLSLYNNKNNSQNKRLLNAKKRNQTKEHLRRAQILFPTAFSFAKHLLSLFAKYQLLYCAQTAWNWNKQLNLAPVRHTNLLSGAFRYYSVEAMHLLQQSKITFITHNRVFLMSNFLSKVCPFCW